MNVESAKFEKPSRRWLDISAISLSALCLIHCLAAGVFLAIISTLQVQNIWFGERFHGVIFVVALLVASFSLSRGWRLYHNKTALILGISGLSLMGSALFPTVSHSLETIFTVTGALLLALAHGINMQAHNKSH